MRSAMMIANRFLQILWYEAAKMVQCESLRIPPHPRRSSKNAGSTRIELHRESFVKKTCSMGLRNAKAFGITNPVSERGSSDLKVQVG
jgi:hypothetical protein